MLAACPAPYASAGGASIAEFALCLRSLAARFERRLKNSVMPAKGGISSESRYDSSTAQGGCTCIMANKRHGMLYIGVTAHIAARVDQHCRDVGSAFCRRHGIKTLILVEWHDTIEDAIVREKALNAWKRDGKIELIEASDPEWLDLFDALA